MLDCILLTETWLDETDNKELIEACPPNFSFLHCSRVDKKGGGVAAIFSNNLLCRNILFGSYSSSLCIQLSRCTELLKTQ